MYESKEAYEAGDEPVAKDASLNNQAQTVNCMVERHVSIQTKAHLEEGSQTFTHGDVVDMFDDVSITHDVLDGSKEAFETILYALFPDGTSKEIWKSGKIDYEVNDKEFTKTVLAEKWIQVNIQKVQVLPSKKLTMTKMGISMENTMKI